MSGASRTPDLAGVRPTGNRASWAAPDCPTCDSEVFVDALGSQPRDDASHVCRLCGRRFQTDTEVLA